MSEVTDPLASSNDRFIIMHCLKSNHSQKGFEKKPFIYEISWLDVERRAYEK
jgi:hypothetical protein